MKEKISLIDEETTRDLLRYIKEDCPKYALTPTQGGMKYTDKDYEVFIPSNLAHFFEDDPYSNYLIYGKNPTKNIVALEIKDDTVFLFFNDNTVETKPMIYWILSDKKHDQYFERLEGSQHYKFIRRFTKKSSYLKTCYRYKHKDLFKIINEKEAAMIYYGYTMFKGLKVSEVSTLSFDIEGAGLSRDKDSKVFLITNTFRNSDGAVIKKHFRVDEYPSHKEMIKDWCDWVLKVDPTVIVGHNIFSYDFPYLQFCYGDFLPLGKKGEPIEIEERESQFRVDGTQKWTYHKIHIFGRHVIDGMFLAVKYDIGRNYPSWGLKQIAEAEGIVKKDRQFYDASKINENWGDPIEREKIVQYGIHDSDDSLALYDLHIPSIFYMTQSVPKPFQLMGLSASGAQLNSILVRAYLQDNYSIPKASEKESISGGISFGVAGVHRNVMKIDVASEYPSIIRHFRVYPVNKDPKKYYTQMVDYFTEERFKNKRLFKETNDRYYNDLQAAQKVFINSSFGLTSTGGLNFNDFNCGDFITGMGRQVIKESLKWATSKDITHWWKDYSTEKDVIYDGHLFMEDDYETFFKRMKSNG
jgi:DNA polymerase elongation subunit (family B)